MAWYDGTITEAITESKKRAKLFVVYLHGNDEESSKTNHIWEEDEVKQFCQEMCICIKLVADSESFNNFSKIYPVVVLPVTFLIGRDGTPLDIVADCTSSQQLIEKLNAASQRYQEQVSSTPLTAPLSAPESETSSGASNNQLTDARRTSEQESASSSAASPEDKAAAATRLQEKLNQKRLERARQAEEKERNDEIERRNLGRSVHEMREKQQQIKMQKELAERKKDKVKEKEALERVRQQIAKDREERNRRFQKEKEERVAEADRRKRKQEEITQRRSEETLREKAKMARIQFRLPNGSSVTRQYPCETTLGEAIQDLRNQPIQLPSDFRLATGLPRRVFQSEDESSSMEELDLTPSAAIVVLPYSAKVQKPGSNVVQSVLEFLFLLLSLPVKLLTYLWKALTGTQQQTSSPRGATHSSSSSEPHASHSSGLTEARRRNVDTGRRPKGDGRTHRLGDVKRDDDDAATWNGNSTQQM